MLLKDFNFLNKNLKKDFSSLKKTKFACLGDSSTQFLVKAIRAHGFDEGFDLEMYEADYDQIDFEISNNQSELYQFKPSFVLIYESSEKLLKNFYKLNKQEKEQFADQKIQQIKLMYERISENLSAKIIYFNFVELNDGLFGNFSNKEPSSFLYQIRKINLELMQLASEQSNLFINDISLLSSQLGYASMFNAKTYISFDLILNLDFLPLVAKNVLDIIKAISGQVKKCIILDLDNTLWGGIIGDDGMSHIQIGTLGIGKAYTELQEWLKQLKERGIILCVCSKNTESIAKEPFENHPDMVLRLTDISVFVANWNNKVENIQYIQQVLNIAFDSIIFIDDNPFEREMVKTHIPEITVPDLPEDPVEYLSYLRQHYAFETASYTKEDEGRTQLYKIEAQRVIEQHAFTNEGDFLSSLNMLSDVQPFNEYAIPRIAQLTQRSNQFNLRTIRYTDDDIHAIAMDKHYRTYSFNLLDKFGDYGLISAVILKIQEKTLFINTWIMSCRVLKRSMEAFIINQIIELAKQEGFELIVAEYIPTQKNVIVKDLYPELGFSKLDKPGNFYELNIQQSNYIKTFIKKK